MISHRLIPAICGLLPAMSCSILMNDASEAQLSQNTLESIVKQPDALTSAQVDVGDGPRFIKVVGVGDSIYVANYGSGTVSVIDPVTNTVIENIHVGDFGTGSFIETYGDAVYVANEFSGTISVIDPNISTVVKNITVGENPTFIETVADYLYVTNTGSGTVSVIDPVTNTVIENITVGENPSFIETYEKENAMYVANSGSGTVSVIDPVTNTVIENIHVGENPTFIKASLILRYAVPVYVANSGSGTVSVIDPVTNTVIENITVGENPSFILQFPEDVTYVANFDSNTVSVIHTVTGEVVAGVTFDINPFRGGQIICNGLDTPINRYFYVSSGTECIAKPKSGFEFDSWVEIFDDNSTRTINASTTSDWLVDPVAALNDVFTDDPAATLTVNRFGNFTAYFKALPPPVPAEFTASIITVVVASIVGSLLIPAVLSWFKSKKQTSRLNSFHLQIDLIYADRKLDKNEIDQSNRLNKDISDSYAAGKISNEQYTHLINEVSTAHQEIFKKRIESITERNTEDLGQINNDITDAYSNGKLSNEHYTNLKNEISNTYQKSFKKRIESITNPSTEDVNNIKNDIEDAYSDRKITELDYNLLNGKISRILDKK